MDPDSCLNEIRALIREGSDPSHLVEELDDYLTQGGSIPAAWQAHRPTLPTPVWPILRLEQFEHCQQGVWLKPQYTWDEHSCPICYTNSAECDHTARSMYARLGGVL